MNTSTDESRPLPSVRSILSSINKKQSKETHSKLKRRIPLRPPILPVAENCQRVRPGPVETQVRPVTSSALAIEERKPPLYGQRSQEYQQRKSHDGRFQGRRTGSQVAVEAGRYGYTMQSIQRGETNGQDQTSRVYNKDNEVRQFETNLSRHDQSQMPTPSTVRRHQPHHQQPSPLSTNSQHVSYFHQRHRQLQTVPTLDSSIHPRIQFEGSLPNEFRAEVSHQSQTDDHSQEGLLEQFNQPRERHAAADSMNAPGFRPVWGRNPQSETPVIYDQPKFRSQPGPIPDAKPRTHVPPLSPIGARPGTFPFTEIAPFAQNISGGFSESRASTTAELSSSTAGSPPGNRIDHFRSG